MLRDLANLNEALRIQLGVLGRAKPPCREGVEAAPSTSMGLAGLGLGGGIMALVILLLLGLSSPTSIGDSSTIIFVASILNG